MLLPSEIANDAWNSAVNQNIASSSSEVIAVAPRLFVPGSASFNTYAGPTVQDVFLDLLASYPGVIASTGLHKM
jgi:hypothetical protein